MRYSMIPLLLFMMTAALAKPVDTSFEARCYAPNGKLIYQGKGEDLIYSDQYLSFHDAKRKRQMFIFGECVLWKNGEHLIPKS